MSDDRPIAWTAIPPRTPVLDADGRPAGTVVEVLGNREEDIFHGLVVDVAGKQRVLLADSIDAISTAGIGTDRSAADLADLPLYEAEKSYHAELSHGILGHLKHERFFEDEEDK